MKKFLISVFILFSLVNIPAAEIPDNLNGIWEGKDRFIFFEDKELVIILKDYYGWYLDRVSEPDSYSENYPRTRNSATPKNAEHTLYTVNILDNGCYDLEIEYSKYQKNIIPVAVIDDNLFIDFYVKDSENVNFWKGNMNLDGITVSPQQIPENLSCLYFLDDKIFDIRYWKSDMDYVEDKASFIYENTECFVNKHIYVQGQLYACTSGRSKKIRNLTAPVAVLNDEMKFYNKNTILVLNEKPYLKKIADRKQIEELIDIVKSTNSKRKPDPEPLFPEEKLDWHWDIIDLLEKNNSIIQEVRKRQNDFGPRGKDIK